MQLKSHIHTPKSAKECEGMSPHIPKWIRTLGVGVSMDFRIFKECFEGQNSLDWQLLYTIENLLKLKCLKWGCIIHLNTYNTSYG
jgi:hypothetical protein